MTSYTCWTSMMLLNWHTQPWKVKVKDVGHRELRRSVGHVLALKSIDLRAGRIYGPRNIFQALDQISPGRIA